MLKEIKIIFIICLLTPSLNAETLSIMSINAQNLFDTIDDPKKDDKAFLPIELKQSENHKNECNNINVKRWRMECFFQDWNKETKDAKLNNLVEVIISYGGNGADVVGL
ncbi:hypothetical protein OAO19_02095, partial [Gammaproteobacteria bacterium]|nr:hypothetical protein [Gammaproteobacteria bacterium]